MNVPILNLKTTMDECLHSSSLMHFMDRSPLQLFTFWPRANWGRDRDTFITSWGSDNKLSSGTDLM
ncbi:hypothetical protein QTP88_025761 [Uroleucon formosanum]